MSRNLLRELTQHVTLVVSYVSFVQLHSVLPFNSSHLVLFDSLQTIIDEVQLLVKRILQLCLLLHSMHVNFHALFLLENAHVGLLFEFKLALHRLDLFARLSRLLLHLVDLFYRVLRFLVFLVHRLLRGLALLCQASKAARKRDLSYFEQFLDFVNVLLDQKLAITQLANGSSLSLSISIRRRTRVNPRLLHALSIV